MLRLVRAYTKREKIVKFDGCYHGHADGFLVQAGSGVATLGLPDSPGVYIPSTELTRFVGGQTTNAPVARRKRCLTSLVVFHLTLIFPRLYVSALNLSGRCSQYTARAACCATYVPIVR